LGQNKLYKSGQFARRASVSVRTLRYYDREGLLAPSHVSDAGYRLYTDDDLVSLQQILALKFLGFTLDEIKALLKSGPRSLADVLYQQKRLMMEKRAHLDGIIEAIDETASLLREGNCDWESLVNVIQVIQMEQNKDWANKYFTPEQLQKMQELGEGAYSDEARRKIAERGATWTEEDQQRVTAQWEAVWAEIRRLHVEGTDPQGPEAEALKQRYNGLISGFTGGDPEVSAGLNKWWEGYDQLPEAEKPFQVPLSRDEQAYLDMILSGGQ
jgi:MerR family transcriptional regulator, thiopeptide resistance regulator